MGNPNVIHSLRQKPHHVRERIAVAIVILFIPVLFYFWYLSFHSVDTSGPSTLETVRSTVSDIFNNPAYEKTFGKALQ